MARGYRPEIDGLRAVAVVSVLLFHAGFGFAAGGFVGVDVFFVISGFLITSLIVKEAEEGHFSFAGFYERRIRRLLPPLVPVLALTGIGAFLLLSQQQYIDYLRSFVATLGFGANWYFFLSVGYFDGAAEFKPLLHMWSLAIEEQFYLIFPLLVVFLVRKAPRALLPVAAVLCVASYAYAVFLVADGKPYLAFFNSFARFWELLVGALLAFAPAWRPNRKLTVAACETIGVALILVAIVTYSEETLFPGASALLPTVGTALVIAAGGRGGAVSALLSSRPFVGIGLISYALYLWHWPILVFLRIAYPAGGTGIATLGLTAAVLLSVASYRFIEKPFRTRAVFPTRRSAYGLLAASLAAFGAIIGAGATAPVTEARTALLPKTRYALLEGDRGAALAVIDEQEILYFRERNLNFHGRAGAFNPDRHRRWTCSFDKANTADRVLECLERQAAAQNVLVIGDSIGGDTTHALRLAFPDVNFIMLHQSGCVPANFPVGERIGECFPGLADLLARAKHTISIDAVVLAFRYKPKNWENVESGLALARSLADNVMMLGVSPMFSKNLGDFVQELPRGEPVPLSIAKSDRTMVGWSFDRIVRQAERLARKHGIAFVNVLPFFCDETRCLLFADGDLRKPLYWDSLHLTRFGIEKYAEFLSRQPQLRAVFLGKTAQLEP